MLFSAYNPKKQRIFITAITSKQQFLNFISALLIFCMADFAYWGGPEIGVAILLKRMFDFHCDI